MLAFLCRLKATVHCDGVAHALPALAVPLLLGLLSGYDFQWGILSAAIIGSLTGFWLWNRHPARIFLGDAGSLPLGLFLGWLALRLSMDVNPVMGLLILAYPLADAGSTLVRRALAGRALTQPPSLACLPTGCRQRPLPKVRGPARRAHQLAERVAGGDGGSHLQSDHHCCHRVRCDACGRMAGPLLDLATSVAGTGAFIERGGTAEPLQPSR